jgi:hypothetical protein
VNHFRQLSKRITDIAQVRQQGAKMQITKLNLNQSMGENFAAVHKTYRNKVKLCSLPPLHNSSLTSNLSLKFLTLTPETASLAIQKSKNGLP